MDYVYPIVGVALDFVGCGPPLTQVLLWVVPSLPGAVLLLRGVGSGPFHAAVLVYGQTGVRCLAPLQRWHGVFISATGFFDWVRQLPCGLIPLATYSQYCVQPP